MWKNLWEHHKGKITGILIGFVLGIIYLICGFWNMLVFAFLMLLGLYFGRKMDRGEKITGPSEIYRWLMERLDNFK